MTNEEHMAIQRAIIAAEKKRAAELIKPRPHRDTLNADTWFEQARAQQIACTKREAKLAEENALKRAENAVKAEQQYAMFFEKLREMAAGKMSQVIKDSEDAPTPVVKPEVAKAADVEPEPAVVAEVPAAPVPVETPEPVKPLESVNSDADIAQAETIGVKPVKVTRRRKKIV